MIKLENRIARNIQRLEIFCYHANVVSFWKLAFSVASPPYAVRRSKPTHGIDLLRDTAGFHDTDAVPRSKTMQCINLLRDTAAARKVAGRDLSCRVECPEKKLGRRGCSPEDRRRSELGRV